MNTARPSPNGFQADPRSGPCRAARRASPVPAGRRAAPLIRNAARWSRYIADSLIETSIARDVLLLTRVDKPALLRRLFELACQYSGQVLSYTKMLGQLQDAGNTTTLAHYLDLLAGAGMVCGLPKYAGDAARSRTGNFAAGWWSLR